MYYGHVSTASNRADWQEAVVLTDQDTGDLIDISLCRITMTVVRMSRNPNAYGGGYGASGYGGSSYGYDGVALTGSTDTGEITLPDVGTFQWLFAASRMSCLHQGEYQIGVRISQDSRTMQLIVGTVNVFEGIDMQ
jgi:hypothetical protein